MSGYHPPQHSPQAEYAATGPYGQYPQQGYGMPQHQYHNGFQPPPYHGYPQQGPSPTTYQQPVTPTYQPQVAKPTPQSCYNCGNPDHWAQDCPEPRREKPAGLSLQEASGHPPFKKFRPNYIPPVITKYAVPPQVQLGYIPPHSYGGQPYSSPGYSNHQGPYPQQMLMSAPPVPYSQHDQWNNYPQQPPYPPHHQPPHQAGNGYPRQPYPVHGSPTGYAQGQPYPSSGMAQYPQQQQGYFPPHVPNQQWHGPPNGNYPMVSPSSNAQFSAYGNGHGLQHQGSVDGTTRSRSFKSSSATPGSKAATLDHEYNEEDDLTLLDMPTTLEQGLLKGKTIAQLVRIPLPTCELDLDEVGGSLPPPFPETGGIVSSRFLTRDNLESVLDPIWRKDDFEKVKMDPALDLLSDDGEYLTQEELIRRLRNTTEDQEEHHSGVEDSDRGRQESVSTYDRRHDSSSRSRSRSPSQHRESPPIPGRITEEKPTSISVTSAPKPVESPTRPNKRQLQMSAAGAAFALEHGSNGRPPSDGYPLNSSSPTRRDSTNRHHPPRPITTPRERDHTPTIQREPTPTYAPGPTDSSGGVYHDPFDPEAQDPFEPRPLSRDMYNDQPRYDRHFAPPPPPTYPPPRRMSSNLDRNHMMATGHNGYSGSGISMSPTDQKTVKDSPHRHRKRDRSSDDGSGNERKRQYDDVTPKLKRRQPKVAEAYSRRW